MNLAKLTSSLLSCNDSVTAWDLRRPREGLSDELPSLASVRNEDTKMGLGCGEGDRATGGVQAWAMAGAPPKLTAKLGSKKRRRIRNYCVLLTFLTRNAGCLRS